MALTDRQKELIKGTWKYVEDAGITETGVVMFVKLFTDNPQLIPLFSFADKATAEELKDSPRLAKHAGGVLKIVGVAVNTLNDLASLESTLTALGGRHFKNYKIKAEYYGPVGEALLYAIGQRAGAALTEEAKAAWVAVFSFVTKVMSEGFGEKK